jgi:hypothetical protein
MSTATLNLRWSEKLNTVLVWGSLVLFATAAWQRSWLLVGLGLLCPLIVVLFNVPMLRFFLRIRGPVFALRVIPVHLMYYFLNGISFGVGLLLQQTIGAPLPNPTMEAYAEMGVQRWPPIPSKHRRSSWTADPE